MIVKLVLLSPFFNCILQSFFCIEFASFVGKVSSDKIIVLILGISQKQGHQELSRQQNQSFLVAEPSYRQQFLDTGRNKLLCFITFRRQPVTFPEMLLNVIGFLYS